MFLKPIVSCGDIGEYRARQTTPPFIFFLISLFFYFFLIQTIAALSLKLNEKVNNNVLTQRNTKNTPIRKLHKLFINVVSQPSRHTVQTQKFLFRVNYQIVQPRL